MPVAGRYLNAQTHEVTHAATAANKDERHSTTPVPTRFANHHPNAGSEKDSGVRTCNWKRASRLPVAHPPNVPR